MVMLEAYFNILGIDNIPLELNKYLNCPSLLRLKNVGYFCGMDYASRDIYDFPEYVSRYDHSLTVALIVWKLTGDLKATLAGLFHDISTPCFSHVIDYMNKDYDKQESTEEKIEEIIKQDNYLLDCLKNDSIDINDIVDFKKHSIVDLDRPMLCSDRLDGVILTGMFWTKSINIDDVRNIISSLTIEDNEYNKKEIGFLSGDVASLVVKTSEIIDVYCHSKEDNFMMELLAKIVRRAILLGLISYDDLFILNENDVFNIFDSSMDNELVNDLDLFRNIKMGQITEINIPNIKVRDLNPLVLGNRFNNI